MPMMKFGRRSQVAALCLGTFLTGAVGVSFVNAPVTPALAQNLSEQVSPNVQTNAPSFADIVDRVSPAVVSIRVKSRSRTQLSSFRDFEGTPFERFFEEFNERFGDRDEDERRSPFGDRRGGRGFAMGQGSGFLISVDGYVVTNGHVVDGAEEVNVILQNGEVLSAEVIGVDDKTDLALVKVENDREFPFVTFATQEVRVGDWVMAVGNPFGLGGTVTAGIVSARGREIGAGPYDDFIQIDAPINRGNSGGPTFNLRGNVVGVNTAIYSPSGGSVGIGFAIPASIAEDVIEDLKDDGEVTRGWLGVQIQGITPEIADSIGRDTVIGALVTEPQGDSPAAAAGIQEGDAIIEVDGAEVEDPRDLARTISSRSPGETVSITVWRDGRERELEVTLGSLEDAPAATQNARGDDPEDEREENRSEELGMTLAPTADVGIEGPGLAVVEVDEDGPAARQGIRVGDVILSVGGTDVERASDLREGAEVAANEGRENVLLKLRSGERTRFVALPVEDREG